MLVKGDFYYLDSWVFMVMSYIHGDFMTHEINEHRFLTSCNVFNFMGHEISKVAFLKFS